MNLIEIIDSEIKTDEGIILIEEVASAKIFKYSCDLFVKNVNGAKEEKTVFFNSESDGDEIKRRLETYFGKRSVIRQMTYLEHLQTDVVMIGVFLLNFVFVLSWLAQDGRIRVPSILYPFVILGSFIPGYILEILIGICFIVLFVRGVQSILKRPEVAVFDAE